MKLKRLTAFVGEQAVGFNNWNAKTETPTPIDFDPETERVIHHKSAREKTVIHLDKVLMYTYEEDTPVVTN